jgi:DNA-binding winged helix-turn-helix (wHTH) protein/pimeloyl-ACP methyl ester carboxylesterase
MNLDGQIYVFGRFRVDVRKRLLMSGNEIVMLPPKAFDTLLSLIENNGSVLSKEDLLRMVWPDEFVEENNLAQNISKIRKVLEEGSGDAKYIETIPKRGYRFVGNIEVIGSAPRSSQREGSNVIHRAAVPNPKTHYAVSTGDVNIAYQVVGDGPLDLVFVMGWVSHLEYFWKEPSFARFLMRLASFSRLILFDKRGTGLSDRVPLSELPTLEQRMTDVLAVMNAVGSKRAAFLGISEGGPMCSLFAATYPERTIALTMIGTYAKRIWSEDYPWAPTREQREQFLERIKSEWGGPVGLEERAPSAAHDSKFREWWAEYLRMGASPAAAVALTRMNAEIDVRNVLPSLRVPTLVLHRKGDTCLPVEGGRLVALLIPGAKYVELEGNDHLPFVGDQDAILDEIAEFLTGVRPERQIERVLTTLLFVQFENDIWLQQTHEIHRSYVRRNLTLHRGNEIEFSDMELFATFDGPARAIRCAVGILESSARLGLRARAALHTGECDVIGDKMAGPAVRLGRALTSVAAFGEVLISHTVRDLVAGSGLEFEKRGVKTFDDVPGQWFLFAVARSFAQSAAE